MEYTGYNQAPVFSTINYNMPPPTFRRSVEVDLTQSTDDEETVSPKKRPIAYIDLTLDSDDDDDILSISPQPHHRAKRLRLADSPTASSDDIVSERSHTASSDPSFGVATGSVHSISSSPQIKPSTHTQLPDDMLLKLIEDTDAAIERRQALLDSNNGSIDFFRSVTLRNEITRSQVQRAEYVETLLNRESYKSGSQNASVSTVSEWPEPGPSHSSWDAPLQINTADGLHALDPIPSVTNTDPHFDFSLINYNYSNNHDPSEPYELEPLVHSQPSMPYVYPEYSSDNNTFYLETQTPYHSASYTNYGYSTATNPPYTAYDTNQGFGNYDGMDALPHNPSRLQKPHGDIREFLEMANREHFDSTSVVDALNKLKLGKITEFLPGLKITLMPHQAIGVAWMLDKENGPLKGGCLADEMGLGKTVQMIATLMLHPPDDSACKTTLIVAPTALLDQWKLEIKTKTTARMACYIYHGSNRVRNARDLMRYDVVLTTYATMAQEWVDEESDQKPKKRKKTKASTSFIVSDDDSDAAGTVYRKKAKSKKKGPLFQCKWYRIVLDEAQMIRNRNTRTSRAVTDLETIYRWCLSGTPIVNNLADAYGQIRFLKIRPWNEYTEFNGHIASIEKRQPDLATRRLQHIYNTFLLRRKKDSKLDGKLLIELPPKEVKLHKLQFSKAERDIYTTVEARSQEKFNKFRKAGTILKNYSHVLVLLLRLRQICCHPALIQVGGDAFELLDEDAEMDDPTANELEVLRATRVMSHEFVASVKKSLLDISLKRMNAEKNFPDAIVSDDSDECPICLENFQSAVITGCEHSFCRECIMNIINSPQNDDTLEATCPLCRASISEDKLFRRSAFQPKEDDDQDHNINNAGRNEAEFDSDEDEDVKPRDKGKGRAIPKRYIQKAVIYEEEEESSDMSDFIVPDNQVGEEEERPVAKKGRLQKRNVVLDSDEEAEEKVKLALAMKEEEEEEEVEHATNRVKSQYHSSLSKAPLKNMPKFVPSTKMRKMMESLETWAQEHPDEKTIVISQWTSCLSLVSDFLKEKKLPHMMYIGSMSREQRNEAVNAFMYKEKACVMLMSLKCGGVGLNLTRANRVISLDLGWSPAIEAQAFDRVHRLGQKRDVHIHRLVIENTVEDRILQLQERKQNLADGSLGEGSGKKLGRLSVRELARLFGLDH